MMRLHSWSILTHVIGNFVKFGLVDRQIWYKIIRSSFGKLVCPVRKHHNHEYRSKDADTLNNKPVVLPYSTTLERMKLTSFKWCADLSLLTYELISLKEVGSKSSDKMP